jgi:Rps23 Pro-64 3,4-dihydroxylase Tpa1-like proline 4-hydroxylase
MLANVSDELSELIHEEIKPYLPEHETIRCNFHLWQPLSGIAEHNDGHRKFGATIYLNEEWPPNAGGWFVWEDEETRQSGIHKALIPTRNTMVLNDNHENHWVTSIAATPPDNRCSIQIWCFDKHGMIDTIDQDKTHESPKLDPSLPKGEKTKT